MSDKDADNRAIEYLKSLAADDGDYAFDALESVLDELERLREIVNRAKFIRFGYYGTTAELVQDNEEFPDWEAYKMKEHKGTFPTVLEAWAAIKESK